MNITYWIEQKLIKQESISKKTTWFFCAEKIPIFNIFFEKIGLKVILSTYSGIVMGQSVGAINMAEHCFNSAEQLEESEPLFFDALGLTNINIEPYFVYDSSRFDEKIFQREPIINESFNRPIYG